MKGDTAPGALLFGEKLSGLGGGGGPEARGGVALRHLMAAVESLGEGGFGARGTV